MSQNPNVPQVFTLSSGTLTIEYARSISVLSIGGTTEVTNFSAQTQSVPDGVTCQMDADSGNTLSIVTIVPSGGTAYVVVLSGLCVLTP